MDFESAVQEARDWIKTEKPDLNLSHVDQESSKLNFDISSGKFNFYLEMMKDDAEAKWHLWSNDDAMLSRIQPIIEDVSNGTLKTVTAILSKLLERFQFDVKKNEDDNEEDDEEEEEDDYNEDYYGEDEDFIDEPIKKEENDDSDVDLDEQESFFGPMNAVTGAAIQRLRKDLKNITKVGPGYGIIAQPRGDNLFYWDVKLTDVPMDSRLGKDLKQYSAKYNQEAVLNLEMQFPQDYPFNPPFIRVLKPRFKFLTGHVTIGGSICMEMLTKSGWVPSNDIESILVQVRAEIMSDQNASLDSSRPNEPYTEQEARDAFNRMVHRYGWNK